MAYSVLARGEEWWRCAAIEVGEWCLHRCGTGGDNVCRHDCRSFCVGCLCEDGGLSLARLGALNALLVAEGECRKWGRHEWGEEQREGQRIRDGRHACNRRCRTLLQRLKGGKTLCLGRRLC